MSLSWSHKSRSTCAASESCQRASCGNLNVATLDKKAVNPLGSATTRGAVAARRATAGRRHECRHSSRRFE